MAWPTSWYATKVFALPSVNRVPSIPATILSTESSISSKVMESLFLRPVKMAASFNKLDKSAPEKPGVLLAMVSMRGEWGETFPWQVPMGQSTIPALEAANVIVHHVDLAEKVSETVNAAAKMAFDSNRAVAVVISQRISESGGKG